jgi:hypothetical protein
MTTQRRRHHNFSFAAKRRREIVLHARHVGAAQTDDFDRWLIAWVWHNCKAKDQIWSLMECAKTMGGKITEAQASEITEEASITRKHLTADSLARFLGVTYAPGLLVVPARGRFVSEELHIGRDPRHGDACKSDFRPVSTRSILSPDRL